jgi:DNA repair exonuclease SbcCD ATPase subunit
VSYLTVGEILVRIGGDASGIVNETKKATVSLSDFESKSIQLNARMQLLSQKLDAQKNIVSSLNAKYQESIRTKGSDAEATEKLHLQLMRAQERENSIQTAMQRANSEIDKQSTAMKKLQNETKGLDDQTQKTQKSIDGMGGKIGLLSGKLNSLVTLIKSAIMVYSGKQFFDFTVGSNAQFEQYTTSFNVLLGSADRAREHLEYLFDFAAKTPFDMPQVVEASKLLETFGLDTRKYLTQIGNAASAFNVPMTQVADAIGRLSSGQTGEAMEQLRRLGISMKLLTEQDIQFDKGGQLTSSIAQTMDAVMAIMDSKYKGMMDEQSKTFNGLMSTIQDNLSAFGRQIGEDVFESLKEKQSDFMSTWDEWSQNGTLDKIADGISGFLVQVVDGLTEAIEIMAAYGKEIVGIISAVTALSAALKVAAAVQAAFNISAAANPYIAIAAGITALVSGIIGYTAATKAAEQQTQKTLQATRQELDNTDQLIVKYETLKSKTSQTTEEKTQLHDIEKKLADLYPAAADGIDSENQKYTTQIDLVKQLSSEKKKAYQQDVELLASQGKMQISSLRAQLSDLDTQRAQLTQQRDAVKKEFQGNQDLYNKLADKIAKGENNSSDKEFQKLIDEVYKAGYNHTTGFIFEMQDKIGQWEKLNGQLSSLDEKQAKLKEDINKYAEAIVAADKLKNPNTYELPAWVTQVTKSSSAGTGKTYSDLDNTSRASTQTYKNEALDAALKVLEHRKAMNQLSLEDEVKTLQAIKSAYVKTADERMDIEERIYTAQKSIQTKRLQDSVNWIATQKELGKLSAEDEIAAWTRVYKNQKDNIEAVAAATKNLNRLKKEMADKEVQDNKTMLDKMVKDYIDKKKSQYDWEEDQEEKRLNDKLKALDKEYQAIEDQEKAADRASERADAEAIIRKYAGAATPEGQRILKDAQDKIRELDRQDAQDARDREKDSRKEAIEQELEDNKAKYQKLRADLETEQQQMLAATEKFAQEGVSSLTSADTKLKEALTNATKVFNANQDTFISDGLKKIRKFVDDYKRIASELSAPGLFSGNTPVIAASGGNSIVTINDYGNKNLYGIDDVGDYSNELMNAAKDMSRGSGGVNS